MSNYSNSAILITVGFLMMFIANFPLNSLSINQSIRVCLCSRATSRL